jgi:hypothetical protein
MPSYVCGVVRRPLPTATPQALLFRSSNLTAWKFVSMFWDGEGQVTAGKIGNRFDTPDFYRLRDGRYAVLYLVNGRTLWMIGHFDRKSFRFVADRQGGVDMGDGSFHCSQSFSDPAKHRILFGWIRLAVPDQAGLAHKRFLAKSSYQTTADGYSFARGQGSIHSTVLAELLCHRPACCPVKHSY